MKAKHFSVAFFIALTLTYQYLFWDQLLGANLGIYSIVLCLLAILSKPASMLDSNVQITGVCALITGACSIYFGTTIQNWAAVITGLTLVGFVYAPELRFTGTAVFAGIGNIITAPFYRLSKIRIPNIGPNLGIFKVARVFIIPLLIGLLFFALYSGANPKFHGFSERFIEEIVGLFERVLDEEFWHWISFSILGIVLVCGVLFSGGIRSIINWEVRKGEFIRRTKIPNYKRKFVRTLALVDHNRMAMLTLIVLNILIILYNVVDIRYIWFEIGADENYKDLVYRGTYSLIFSILLSIWVLLWLFKGNLNFYSKNTGLKKLAWFWISQSIIIVFSVLLRNITYIQNDGLGYKRIQVFFFLALCITGLITMIIKVRDHKSAFYLFRINGWIALILITGSAFIDWNSVVFNHNINFSTGEVKQARLISELPDRLLPQVWEARELLANYHFENLEGKSGAKYYLNRLSETALIRRIENYKEYGQRYGWQSYSISEKQAMNWLTNNVSEKQAP